MAKDTKGQNDKETVFKKAEALGQIVAGGFEPEAPKAPTFESEIISTPQDFTYAIGKAQMDMQEGGKDYVEVTEELFKYLIKNQKTRYLTYGSPGVKVYLAGTKDECDLVDSMSVDENYNREIREKSRKANGHS